MNKGPPLLQLVSLLLVEVSCRRSLLKLAGLASLGNSELVKKGAPTCKCASTEKLCIIRQLQTSIEHKIENKELDYSLELNVTHVRFVSPCFFYLRDTCV